MNPGSVLEGRFEIEREVGYGGMGTVYRAVDRKTSQPVAVKLLRGDGADERFAREISTLAELSHPRIVKYIASGTTPEGARYLAMEWLEGEDLAARLSRAPLTAVESVELLRRLAEALAAAHRRGIVHRDLKPSNVFLPNSDLAAVKLLDFGIARRTRDRAMTRTGAVLGTPEYMAPEQARGERNVDARVDVFALGCVLFECLAGYPPFAGDTVMAVLAKILLEDPPRLSELRGDVPADLDSLVSAMLSKDPRGRPADANAVIEAASNAMRALEGSDLARPAARAAASLTGAELRVVCVVLAADATRGRGNTAVAETLASDEQPPPEIDVTAYGARVALLADGSVLALISGEGTAADHALRAAHCALAMRTRYPKARIAVATGRALMTERVPIGEVIDRATRTLRAAEPGGALRLDEATAGLVDARFELGGDGVGLFLGAERIAGEKPRTLLGKPTSCVGRERELRTLQGVFEESCAEPGARVALVTAPAGVGKSRLLHEFIARLADEDPAPAVLIARGDAVRARAPFATMASAIRRAAGIVGAEPPEAQRARLRARIARHVSPADLTRVTEFVGELVGVDAGDSLSEKLRVARGAPAVMADAVQIACVDWLRAEAAHTPLVLAVEDLHWADLPSVRLVGALLEALSDLPFTVVALAREEVRTRFPDLWNGREVADIPLGALTRKSAEKLAREVLGPGVDAAVIARVLDRCEGNAFFLEETLRAVAAGTPLDVLPDSVLGVLQTRLDQLSPDARRALRAASVFGSSFCPDGVRHLLGSALRPTAVTEAIDDLVARELVAPGGDGGQHAFRHALIRDAAYAMLADSDRALGHRLAAEWLETAGETNAIVLAEHYDKGGEREKSIQWYLRGAETTYQAGDAVVAIAQAQRGIDLGAAGEDEGRLRCVQALAYIASGDSPQAMDSALRAKDLLRAGSVAWFRAIQAAMTCAADAGSRDPRYDAWIDELILAAPEPGAEAQKLRSLLESLTPQMLAGRRMVADRIRTLVIDLEGATRNLDVYARAMLAALRSGPVFTSDLSQTHRTVTEAMALYRDAGAMRDVIELAGVDGFILGELGHFEEAEAVLRENCVESLRFGAHRRHALALHNLGYALCGLGRLDEAARVEGEAVEAFRAQKTSRLEAAALIHLARIQNASGDFAAAESSARAAMDLLPRDSQTLPHTDAVAQYARALVGLGRAGEALACLREHMGPDPGWPSARRVGHLLALAESLHALGRDEEARETLRDALRLIDRVATNIHYENDRASFVARAPDCVAVHKLAAAWGVKP